MNIKTITDQELHEAAQMFVMSVIGYVGFDKTGLEVAGAAHTVLNLTLQDLNQKHEETIAAGSGQIESGQGDQAGSRQIPEAGADGRAEESPQGVRPDESPEPAEGSKEQREDAQNEG